MAIQTSRIVAGAAFAAFVGLAAAIALTPGPADAGYGVDQIAPKTLSNTRKKGDRISVGKPAKPGQQAMEVADIRKLGDDVIFLDSKGRIVYRSNAATRTTTVEKNVNIPLLTGYGVAVGEAPADRIDTAFEQTGN
jgi:hypothetical protein